MHRKGYFSVKKHIKRFGGKRHELTLSQRKLVIQLLEQNKSQSEIAKTLACSQSQISRIAAKKLDILALYAKCKNPDSIRRKSRPRRTRLFSHVDTTVPKTPFNEIPLDSCSIGNPEYTASTFSTSDIHTSHKTNINQDTTNCVKIKMETESTGVDNRIDSSTTEDMCSSTNDVIEPRDHSPTPHPDSDEAESRDKHGDVSFLPDSVDRTTSLNSGCQNVSSDFNDSLVEDFAIDLSNMRPRRGKALTLVHKKLIIEMLEAKKSQTEIARMFGKSQSVVSRMAAKKARILDQWNSVQGSDRARLIREKDECEMILCPSKSSSKVTTTGHVSEEEEATSSSDIYHKRQALSLSQKMEIIDMLNHKSSQRDIAKVYGKSQAVISRIAGRKDIILNEWQKQNRIKSRLSALFPEVTESGAGIYESSSDISASDIQESEEGYRGEKPDGNRFERPEHNTLVCVENYRADLRPDAYSGDVDHPAVIPQELISIPSIVQERRSWFRLPKEASLELENGERFSTTPYITEAPKYNVQNARALYSVPSISRRKRYRGLLLSERRLAIKLLEENKSQTEIARILGCSQSQISRIQAKKNSIINMSDTFTDGGQADDSTRHTTEQSDYEYGRPREQMSGDHHASVVSYQSPDLITKEEYCDTGTESRASFSHFPTVLNTTTKRTQNHDVSECSDFDFTQEGVTEMAEEKNEQFRNSDFDTSAGQFEDMDETPSVKFDTVESDPVPSAADALNGLRTIRRYMQFSGIQNFQFFNSLESQLFSHISKLLR